MRLLAPQASGHSGQQQHRDRAPSSLHLNFELCPGNFDAELFRKPLADLFR
jgi:hypothetical protein